MPKLLATHTPLLAQFFFFYIFLHRFSSKRETTHSLVALSYRNKVMLPGGGGGWSWSNGQDLFKRLVSTWLEARVTKWNDEEEM